MTTTANETGLKVQTFNFSSEVRIAAPIDITWEAVLAELGPESTMPDGKPFPFKFEPWPGGRWFRDLGDNTGHLWGHVQVIKPPALLEISGPMFISYPASNHLQYRLTPDGDNTRLKITHSAHGLMPKDFMVGADEGWSHGVKRIEEIAERIKRERGVFGGKGAMR